MHRTGNRKDSWEEWEWEDGGWERRSWQNKPWWEKGDSREREDWGAGKPGESTTSGSYRERQRLHHIQAKHGQPRNQEELDLQRLSAMGQSRFKRLADRKERRAKEEAAKQEAFQAGANWQFQLQQLQPMQQWQAHQGRPSNGRPSNGVLCGNTHTHLQQVASSPKELATKAKLNRKEQRKD